MDCPGRKWLCLLLLFLSGACFAQRSVDARHLIENSMVVTGHVLIDFDGTVSGWDLDQPEKLPSVVTELLERATTVWRFEPVVIDGEARRAKSRMRLRLVAKRLEDGNYRVSIQNGYFGKDASQHEPVLPEDTNRPSTVKRVMISYPDAAVAMGAQGTVYIALRFGRDGRVQDIITEQVNLRTHGTPQQMERARELLATAAIRSVRRWTFRPPATGDAANADSWKGRVTVDFTSDTEQSAARRQAYGRWQAYIPGPRQRIPWTDDDLGEHGSPDLFDQDGLQLAEQGYRLLTPLQEG